MRFDEAYQSASEGNRRISRAGLVFWGSREQKLRELRDRVALWVRVRTDGPRVWGSVSQRCVGLSDAMSLEHGVTMGRSELVNSARLSLESIRGI